MNSEILARIINSLEPVLTYTYIDEPYKWFYSFGTLLYFIRDKNMGKKFNTDFDISILGGEKISTEGFVANMSQFGYKLVRKTVNDRNGHPLQLVFKPDGFSNVGIDIYFWQKVGNFYWHSFREGMSKGGKFHFKATPALAFKGDPYKYVWEEIAVPVNIPKLYGTLLDIWYPGWFIPDKNFGYSKCAKEVKISSCKNLKEKLV